MTDEQSIFRYYLKEDEYIIWQTPIPKTSSLSNLLSHVLAIISLISFIMSCMVSYSLVARNSVFASLNWDELPLILTLPFIIFIVAQLPRNFFSKSRQHYAITNQRILFYNDELNKEISLLLLQDAIKTKPKNRKASIKLYNSRSATGELPKPIATMNNLSEKDAESAYELLIQARDISFEERIEDMGLD